jgi:hypothetical protein
VDLTVHPVLGNLDAFLITVGDMGVLPTMLAAAERYETRPSGERHTTHLHLVRMTATSPGSGFRVS